MAANFPKWFPFGGFGLVNFKTLNSWFNNPQVSYENSVTAHAGGGQANAYLITARITRISVCASANDSLKLPRSSDNVGCASLVVINDGAQDAKVYPYANATIDGGAASAAVTVGAGKRTTFYCVASGGWISAGASKST